MIILSKTVSARVVNAMRLIKAICFGKNDVRECNEVGPYGWDSCPQPGVVAVYMDTTSKGDNVIVGYANKGQICTPGESRMFFTDTAGALKYFVHVKEDKIVMGIGTPANHLTQWEGLNTALQAYFTSLNTAIGAGVVSGGGTYTPPSAPSLTTAKTTNILIN